jgi:hypothetical protein
MNYQEACQKVEASRKQPNNYLKIELSYNLYLLLPYKAGVTLIECLNHAEEYEYHYSDNPVISPLKQNQFKITPLSEEEYRNIKIANLMGVKLEELKTPPKPTV